MFSLWAGSEVHLALLLLSNLLPQLAGETCQLLLHGEASPRLLSPMTFVTHTFMASPLPCSLGPGDRGNDINGQSAAGPEKTSKNNCCEAFNTTMTFKDLEFCPSSGLEWRL